MWTGTVSKLEFYLAPFGLNLDRQAPGFTQTEITQWRAHCCVAFCKSAYIYIYIYIYIYVKTLGHAAHTCILFGKNHFPNSRDEKEI